MDSTNTSDSSISKHIVLISSFIGYYGVCSISFMGILMNQFINYLLQSKSLENIFYKYISVKAVIDTFVCLIGVFHLNNVCISCGNYAYSYVIIFLRFSHLLAARFMFMIAKKIKCTQPEYAIYNYSGYGPTFGGRHNLLIIDNSNLNSLSFHNLSDFSYIVSDYPNLFNAGHGHFQVSQIEIYLNIFKNALIINLIIFSNIIILKIFRFDIFIFIFFYI